MQQNQNILVFGELLIRLSSKTNDLLDPTEGVTLYPGGSEANVAASLAHFRKQVSYVTVAPNNALAETTLKHLSDI